MLYRFLLNKVVGARGLNHVAGAFSQFRRLHSVCHLLYRSKGTQRSSFLPCHDMTDVIPGEDDRAVWLDQCFVPMIFLPLRRRRRCLSSRARGRRPLLTRPIASNPETFVVLDFSPA